MDKYKIIVLGLCLAASRSFATQNPSVTKLLDKYAETQDKLQSFILKCETSDKADYQMVGKTMDHRSASEVRYDGDRCLVDSLSWGRTSINMKEFYPKEKAGRGRYLWDGKWGLTYTGGSDSPYGSSSRVIIDRNSKAKDRKWMITQLYGGGSVVRGFLRGDDERIDSILRRANKASVRVYMEEIGESNCYVIDAKTEHGDYTVWIDPSRGHNIVKTEVQKYENQWYMGRPLPKDNRISHYLKDIRLKKIQDVWIPVEGHTNTTWLSPQGKILSEKHHVITDITLNPDHDALDSFETNFIENGALVALLDVKGITYTWQDGKLVPKIDEAVISEIDKMTEEIMAGGTGVEPTVDSAGPTVSELLKRYAETQDKLKSFIAKAETTIEHTGAGNRTENETCEFRTDGRQVSHRSSIWGKQSSKDKALYKSFLWDGESLTQYNKGLVFIGKNEISKQRVIATEYKGSPLLGIFGDNHDRIDSVLRKIENATVQQLTEKVGDSHCHLIEATTIRGGYKVWIDPQHGYNIAGIEIEQKGNTGAKLLFKLKNVRFEKIDDVWVPMEADMERTEGSKTMKWHHKRTEMTLNPDHDTLKSFIADDIPDGTKVNILGEFGNQ